MDTIHFSSEQWARIRETYDSYWNKTIRRPVTGAMVREYAPCRDIPLDKMLLCQKNCTDLSITPDEIADAIEAHLSQFAFYGDAYPMFSMDAFGPGVVAAFLGAELNNSTGNVWFHPKKEMEVSDIHFTYDPDNPWLRRIKEIYKKTAERFEGNIVMGMTDLGGIMDILSTFRPGANLLYDLYDYPEEVKRLIGEAETFWMQYYRELHEVCGCAYSDWSGLYSEVPSYVIQCDFCYMIGPEMFREFVLPTLQKNCRELDHVLYHLDGPGELVHLDDILSIPELDAVQWIPGAGNPPPSEYPDIYRRIREAGKQIQVPAYSFECLEKVIQNLGSPDGVQQFSMTFEASDKDYVLNSLRTLNIPTI